MRKTTLYYVDVAVTLWGGGTAVEISHEGTSAFLQGEDALPVLDMLEACNGDTRERLLELLSETAPCE